MSSPRFPIPQGTLDMLILQILAWNQLTAMAFVTTGADFAIRCPGESGIALSGSASARTEGVAAV